MCFVLRYRQSYKKHLCATMSFVRKYVGLNKNSIIFVILPVSFVKTLQYDTVCLSHITNAECIIFTY